MHPLDPALPPPDPRRDANAPVAGTWFAAPPPARDDQAPSNVTRVVGPESAAGPDAQPPEVASAPASALFGRFVRVARLGTGGMGEVYKAWDPTLRRWVALKVLLAGAEQVTPWFQREGRLAAQLHHPGLVAIHEVGEVDGRPFIAMQYMEGRTLDRLSGASREQVVSLLRDAAAAIGYAHEQGIVHRDLKPENLLVESRPVAKDGAEPAWEHHVCILDFGVARAMGSAMKLTAGWAAIGTPLYMSPEQSRGESPQPAGDVYSLGATLYELLVGAPPIRGTSIQDTIRLIQKRDPVPLRMIDPSIPRSLAAIVNRCLAKDAADRYRNGTELAEDLGRYLRGDPVEAGEPGRFRAAWKWVQRRRFRVAALVLVTAVAAAGGFLAAGVSGRERKLAEETHRLDLLHATVARDRAEADACLAGGDSSGARAALELAEQACRKELASGDFAEALLVSAEVARARQELEVAESRLTRALALAPGYEAARTLRGIVRAALWVERRDRAMTSIGGARLMPGPIETPTNKEIESAWPELRELRRAALLDLRDPGKAGDRFPEEEIALARAWSARLSEDAPGALQAVQDALKEPRPSASLLVQAAFAALESGDAARADALAERATSLWPGDAGTHLARARTAFACAGTSDRVEGIKKYSEASLEAARAQSMGARGPDAALVRGEADLAREEFAKAESAFSEIIPCEPECVSALLGRAKARVGLGHAAEAVLDYREALRRLPDSSCLRPAIEAAMAGLSRSR